VSCPGDLLSALVDGELDHAARERVLSHLLACPPCSTEVQALRALKTRLSWAGAETPLPPDALTARLLGLAVPGVEPVQRRTAAAARPARVRGPARPPARPRRSSGPRRLRRRTVGGCLVALGLTTAFVLGGPSSPRKNDVRVDPTTDVFVADFVDTTTEVPLTEPVDAAVVGTSR
jgi:anti-sigma factor RsiW